MSYSYTRSKRLSIVLSYSYTPPYNVDVRHPAQNNAARSIVSTSCPAHRMDEGRQKKKKKLSIVGIMPAAKLPRLR